MVDKVLREFMGVQVVETAEKWFRGFAPDFDRTVAKPLQSGSMFLFRLPVSDGCCSMNRTRRRSHRPRPRIFDGCGNSEHWWLFSPGGPPRQPMPKGERPFWSGSAF